MNQLLINAAQSSNSRLKKTKMKTNLHLLSRGAVFFAASSSLSLPSVAAAASSDDLQSTRRQLSDSYTGNHRALRDEQPSEEKPDVASIINGTATGEPLSYQVGLAREVGVGKLLSCSGSLIASHVVLTAAHCVVDDDYTPLDPPPNKVLINGYDLATGAIPDDSGYVAASSYVTHPDFNSATGENDIALWILPFPIAEDEHFKFATLNEDDNVPAVDEELFVSGWGKTSPLPVDDRSTILLGTNVDYITNEQCQTDYDPLDLPPITDGMMCTAADRTGTCFGDSGGPLMIANGDGPAMNPPIQVGIVSRGQPPCGTYPGVYTRVSSYIDWIRSTACEEVGELCPSSSKSGKGKSKAYKDDSP